METYAIIIDGMITPPETPPQLGPQKAMRGLYVALPAELMDALDAAVLKHRTLKKYLVEDALRAELARLAEKARQE